MSDVPKTVEDTPVPAAEPTPVVEATEAAKPSEATAESEPNATVKPNEAEAAAVGDDAGPAPAKEETPKDSEATVEATPASEGLLGYKAPGLFPKFRFHDHFFWLDDAPSPPESLNAYIRSKDLKDLKSAHPVAAWAEETGKGLLFYAKRAEDKSTPAGIINLSEASSITSEGVEFFFKVHGDKHTFKAKSTAERSSWVVALEKKIEEAKAIKDEIQGSEGYKKHMEAFAKTPAVAAATTAATSTSHEQKKSLDATTATNAANKNVADTDRTTEEKKEKDTKSRSQSRKRSSIFGALLGKKEEKDEQKEVKKEEKAEEKAEKEEAKEEKKEEAKATQEPGTATEAAGAGAGAAAAVGAEEKKDDKHESETTTPTTEKKSKRGSIFGSLFSKKDAASPTSEKAEKEAGPSVPAKDAEVLPVSETAPKIEEPIANKPIDTAAVTAPIDTAQTPAAADEAPTETAKETAPAETATTPTKEKKGGILGFIKKEAAKLEGKKEVKKEETTEKKEEKAAEEASKDPDAAAAAATTESPTSAEEAAAPATEEARPTDKRRSSLFGNLGGTIRKRTHNTESTDAEATGAATKREKSPLPQRIGSLFRRPSRGVKSEEPKEATEASTESTPATQTAPVSKDEPAVTNGSSTEVPSSAVAGDVVPEAVHSTLATTTPEVKASA